MPCQLHLCLILFLALTSSFLQAATPAVSSKFTGELSISNSYLRPRLQGAFTATVRAGDIVAGEQQYAYFAQRISPDTTGEYTIEIESTTVGQIDTVLFLYDGSVDPTRPLINILAGNDDISASNQLSRLSSVPLTKDSLYVLVVSSFVTGVSGSVNFSVAGPGKVIPIANHRIEGVSNNVNLTGTVTVVAGGVINGGTINGVITSSGTIAGRVSLGPGSTVNGGSITGIITGDATRPALIENAVIAAGARLENVIIGAGTTLSPGVILGANVQFSSNTSIPPGMDLTSALSTAIWRNGDLRRVPLLDTDVVVASGGVTPPSILRSIQLLDGYEPDGNDITQSSTNGELLVVTTDSRSAVLPVGVTMAAADDEEGTYINEDGNILFISTTRRAVLGYPVLVNNSFVKGYMLARGLQLHFSSRADLRIEASPSSATYLSGRPEASALRTLRHLEEGMYSHPIQGLAALGYSIVFRTEGGQLMEQDLVPVPADWLAFKNSVNEIPGVTDVRINTQGIISVMVRGNLLRGRAAYGVTRGAAAANPDDTTVRLEVAGDLNGDGSSDYWLHYPNGDVQGLLIYP